MLAALPESKITFMCNYEPCSVKSPKQLIQGANPMILPQAFFAKNVSSCYYPPLAEF